MKKKTAIIVPAHNESEVIGLTISSLLQLVKQKDIYVINDGSTDDTSNIAKSYGVHVLDINPGKGKANAINTAIAYFSLIEKYEYIMPVDADTLVAPNFLDHTSKVFDKDIKEKVACVIGKVVGKDVNGVTAYRLWEYEIAQSIHKSAQSVVGAIIVCPGPSTVFRSRVFEKISLPTDTITEDMDFTFLIHRKKLGKIVYCGEAEVYTQDPQTLRDLLKQLSRWYKGFWQCVFKHKIPWGGQVLDLEVAILATEGLFNGIFVAVLVFMTPLVILYGSSVLLPPLIFDFVFFLVPTIAFVARKQRKSFWSLLRYIPQFYAIRLLASILFLKSFFVTVIETQLTIHAMWNTKRYQTKKEETWPNLSVQ